MKILATLLVILIVGSFAGCRACKKSDEPVVTISAAPVTIEGRAEEPAALPAGKGSNVKHITIGPGKGEDEEPAAPQEEPAKKISDVALPPNTFEETDLSARLREKMLDAYKGREDDMPDVKIYLSDMKYDEFVNYYKGLGYSVRTVAVPARQVIEPVLDLRPELAGKINLSAYDDVVIHQVMVDDAGISAADKYIDPDTFQVLDKTFVAKVNK